MFRNLIISIGVLQLFILISCQNDIGEVNKLISVPHIEAEIAENIELIYSDSAQVRVRLTAPMMHNYSTGKDPRSVFPEGIHVEFLKDNLKPGSWMDADHAVRHDRTGLIEARENVIIYNSRQERLLTHAITWDEASGTLSNDQIVKIIRPEKGDTIMGFGILANQEFTRFEIKRKMNARLTVKELGGALSGNN